MKSYTDIGSQACEPTARYRTALDLCRLGHPRRKYRRTQVERRSLSIDSLDLMIRENEQMERALLNETFGRNYECSALESLPSAPVRTVYYPGASEFGGRDGVLAYVKPTNLEPWVGVFAFGEQSLTGIYTCPDPAEACVVARGAGYIVNVQNPTRYIAIDSLPILGVHVALDLELLIFHNFTQFVAYGRGGRRWRSQRISYDGISVDAVGSRFLNGRARDVVSGADVPFRLDLRTGAHEGGSY